MRARLTTVRRGLWFFALEQVALPVVAGPLRFWVRSWRLDRASTELLREVAARPRLVIATFHGMLFHLLAFATPLRLLGRKPVVLVSPSRDGSLLANVLARFGIDSVRGTEGSRGVAGSREFARAVAGGAVGIVAIDGPRGPLGVGKPGVLRLRAAADAELLAAATAAGPGLRFGSWDRAHLPLPGASVKLATRLLPLESIGDPASALGVVEATLVELARAARQRRPAS